MKITNKELVQSYVLTTAKYDFTLYEKRILYRIVEVMQAYLSGKKLTYNYSINPDLFDDVREFILPIHIFQKDEGDGNNEKVKK